MSEANHRPVSSEMTPPVGQGGFGKFIFGLVVGLVVGLLAGAGLAPLVQRFVTESTPTTYGDGKKLQGGDRINPRPTLTPSEEDLAREAAKKDGEGAPATPTPPAAPTPKP